MLCLLAALSFSVMSVNGNEAGAEVLSGHIEHGTDNEDNDDQIRVDGGFPSQVTPITKILGAPQSAPQKVARSLPPAQGSGPIPPNSFPQGFAGRWQCQTRVTDSAVESVAVGTNLVSEVQFEKRADGRVVAVWLQPGWTESQAAAVAWNANEARVDRTCYYFGDGMNGAWASRSRDHFVAKSADNMECDSYIDQYLDGRYLGRYRTVSVLTRLGTINTIARSDDTQ